MVTMSHPQKTTPRPGSMLARLMAGVREHAPDAAELGPLPPEAPTPDEPGHPEWHRCQRVAFAMKRWQRATPPRYRAATVTDPRVHAWVQQGAAHFAHPAPDDEDAFDETPPLPSLLLTGTTGTGKTHQAYGALRGIAESGPRRRYGLIATTAADMYGQLRPTGQVGAAEHQMRQYATIPLLLLDDIGSAKASEWTEEITYRLINERYNSCLPTLFTSNLPPRARTAGRPDLASALGDRVVSRLAEMTTVVSLTGADRRRAGAA